VLFDQSANDRLGDRLGFDLILPATDLFLNLAKPHLAIPFGCRRLPDHV
jgi:hypothetical protein